MRIVLGKHALDQARARGISISEIKKTIQRGAKYLQNGKIIAEFMHLRIVYKKREERYFIITVIINIPR